MSEALFLPTGGAQTFTVPRHVPGTLKVTLRGGRGRRSRAQDLTAGGAGGRIAGFLDLPRGTSISVVVGVGAASSSAGTDGEPWIGHAGLGPFLGGQGGDAVPSFDFSVDQPTTAQAGGGGGASDLRVGGTGLEHRVIVAGGGGGGGDGTIGIGTNCVGGAGGLGVASGGTANQSGTGFGGTGGTTSAGGTGGASTAASSGSTLVQDGQDGSAGSGGDAGRSETVLLTYGGAGGGGGFFGGGGGGAGFGNPVTRGPGGGGSSWANTTIVSGITSTAVSPGGWTGSFILFEWKPFGHMLGLARGRRAIHT